MCNRAGQVDVSHTFTTDLGQCDFSTTFFTHHTTMLHSLVFPAKTLVVFYRAEYGSTKQAITFRLECSVIDGFGLFNFTKRP